MGNRNAPDTDATAQVQQAGTFWHLVGAQYMYQLQGSSGGSPLASHPRVAQCGQSLLWVRHTLAQDLVELLPAIAAEIIFVLQQQPCCLGECYPLVIPFNDAQRDEAIE